MRWKRTPKDGEAAAAGTRVSGPGDPISAEKEIRLAMAHDQPVAAHLAGAGRVAQLQGQFQKALDETAAARWAKAPELLCLRGDAYLALGKLDDASQLYRRRCSTPSQICAGADRHGPRWLSSSATPTRAPLRRAGAGRRPRNTEALLFHGDLLRAQNKTAEALATYDKVIAINPVHRTAHVEKAYLDIGIGDFRPPRRAGGGAQDRPRQPAGGLQPGLARLFGRQERGSAGTDPARAAGGAGTHAEPAAGGRRGLNLGSLHQAEHFLRQYLEKNPDNVYARKMLAQSLLTRGNSPRALEVLAPALKKTQQDVQLLALAGESYMQAGNFNQAGQFFERASALDPKAANLRMSLAMSKLGKGDTAARRQRPADGHPARPQIAGTPAWR